jgi:hypothetical protein
VLRVVRSHKYCYSNNQQYRCISTSRRTDHIMSYFLILHHPVSYNVTSISPNTMSYADVYNQIRFDEDVPAEMAAGLAGALLKGVGAAVGSSASANLPVSVTLICGTTSTH